MTSELHEVPWYTCDPKDYPPRCYVKNGKVYRPRKARALTNSQNSIEASARTTSIQNPVNAKGLTTEIPPVNLVETTEKTPEIVSEKVSDARENGQPTGPFEVKSWAQLVRSKEPVGDLSLAPSSTSKAQKSIGEVLSHMPDFSKARNLQHCQIYRGLVNSNNICFMNSILQVLIHCDAFYSLMKYIMQHTHQSISSKTPVLDGILEFIQDYESVESSNGSPTRSPGSPNSASLAAGSKESTIPSPLSVNSFYSVIHKIPQFSHLELGRQEDAEEFLGYLLDVLSEELSPDTTSSGPAASPTPEPDSWQEVGKNSKTIKAHYSGPTNNAKGPITAMFSGRLKSTLKTSNKQPSITFDPFQHIPVDIADPSVNSVESAIKLLCAPEKLQYSTSRGEITAQKRMQFESLPPILIVHLKRFTYTAEVGKITKPISFGTELIIPAETTASGKAFRYELFAVVYHHGHSATAGHYTVDIVEGGQWTNIDDVFVKPDSREIHEAAAYILFYKRLG